MRIAALCLLVFIGFQGGVLAGEGLLQTADLLEKTVRFLKELQTGLRFRQQTYAELLNATALTSEVLNSTLFVASPEFQQQLESAITQGKCAAFFNEKQLHMLQEALLETGFGTRVVEEERLSFYIEYFKQQAEDAKNTEKEKRPLYRSLGLYIGILAAILLA